MLVTDSKELIKTVLSNPNAPSIVEEINQVLTKERQKRQQFYNDIQDDVKAEFVNGKIIIHEPVTKEHNDINGALHLLLSSYVLINRLGYVGYTKMMISLTRNDYEPDLCFFNNEKAKHFKQGQSLFPAPDLVVEVLSKGTASHDRGVKFKDYEHHKVLEYWLIHPTDETVEQYRLNDIGQYELILKADEGTIECKAVKGFSIDIAAIFDETANIKALKKLTS